MRHRKFQGLFTWYDSDSDFLISTNVLRPVHTVRFFLNAIVFLKIFSVQYSMVCSHGAIGYECDLLCISIGMHITFTEIARNRYGTHSCATSHIPLHHMQSKSHHVNSIINIHTIHFLHRKRTQKNALCERAFIGVRCNCSHGAIATIALNPT